MTKPIVISPAWRDANRIRIFSSTRAGGVSSEPYNSLNLGLHVNDNESDVQKNRQLLQESLAMPSQPVWLNQVHSADVHCAFPASSDAGATAITADASWTDQADQVVTVLTADCLPVVIASQENCANPAVAVAHAGWRGLADGVIQNSVAAFAEQHGALRAWLGPAIGPDAFEVGPEVREAFLQSIPDCVDAFVASANDGKWMANLYALARQVLNDAGVEFVSGGDRCTLTEHEHFFSHRREGPATGRMATFAWIASHT